MNKTIKKINSKANENYKIFSGTKKQPKNQKNLPKMAKNETYGGPFFGPKYFFHKAICITEKIRPYLKSLVKI